MKIIYVNCGGRDKCWSDLRSIEHYLSSGEIKAWKKPENLHKVSDVYHNNYLMQCLKVIYADGNRSLIHKRELSPWYITESCCRREASYILVTRCTIYTLVILPKKFGNMSRILSLGTFTVLCSLMCVVKCKEDG